MYGMLVKLLRALNSSQSPWQASVAIALGAFIGFSPVFAPHNLIIYLLAFLLNVNLGLFFVSVAVFALIGYTIDPLIEALGYHLLTMPQLESTWTALYNNPWSILTSFNNSMVIGSLSLSAALFVPLVLILNAIVGRYRLIIGNMPLLRLLLAKPTGKKPSITRWWGALLFVILAALIVFVAFLFSDRLIKHALEDALSKPIGYQVTIDSLKTSLSPLGVSIEGVRIPDHKNPMQNIVEIGHIGFSIDVAYLLHKKALIDELSADRIALQTPRKTAAVKIADVPSAAKQKEESSSNAVNDFFSDMAKEIPDAKTLIKNEKLKTIEEAQKALARSKQIREYWENAIKTKFDKKIVIDLEDRYKALEKQAKNLKNERDLLALLESAKAFHAKVKNLREEYAALQKQFESDRKEVAETYRAIIALPKEDYEALRGKYGFDFDGAFNLAQALLGSDVTDTVKTAIEWYEFAQPYIQQAQSLKTNVAGEPLPKPERAKGRIVAFKEIAPKPAWWVKKASFGVITKNGNELEARLFNATADQSRTKEAMVFELTSKVVKGYKQLAIRWIHDRRGVTKETIAFDWLGIEKQGFKSGKFSVAPMKLDWQVQGVIDQGRLEAKGKLKFNNVKMAIDRPKTEIEKLLQQTIATVKTFDVNMRFWDNPLLPKSAFSSDL
ncbi:MAG: TIGR03545 family protein, partial [Helicobacteraceae bacterium]|nr:TIGR03545 family protein [Helicobacteraceae bacterium]